MSLDDELSIEEQKRLTEFLGECPHEWLREFLFADYQTGMYRCSVCGILSAAAKQEPKALDFSDWRVVGMLIEKFDSLNVEKAIATNGLHKAQLLNYYGRDGQAEAKTPQLAICRAVLAYLKEGEQK